MAKTPSKRTVSNSPENEVGSVVRHGYVAEWSGPLPPPATLEAFDRLVENGAARIFDQFETEAQHRRGLETSTVRHAIRSELIGQILAGLFAFGALAAAAYALALGAEAAASIIGGGSIAMVVTAFLKSKSSKP